MSSLVQILIALTGVIAIVLALVRRHALQRYAPIVGLVGQPFWLIATFEAQQWGMFAVSMAYTCVWSWALWRDWV